MAYKAVIFDLDGTLLDTLEDIGESMNRALRQMGFPQHEIDSYRYFVGDGAKKLAERVLPESQRRPKNVAICLDLWHKEYDQSWANKSRPYKGAVEMLKELKNQRLKIAVLSNKPDAFTKQAVRRLLPGIPFDVVRGHVEGTGHKPDPTSAKEVMSKLAVNEDDVLYVGDTATDMKTAAKAGFFPLGALWGFRDKEELLENGAKALAEMPMGVLEYIEQ